MEGYAGRGEGGRRRDFSALLRAGPEDGAFAVHRDLFRDEELFALEQAYLFERNWVFLAHESQIANPHDFYTTFIGRQPVILMRDGAGALRAFLNACAHKGATVCHRDWGNAESHICPYHGWVYDSAGANMNVRAEKQGFYPDVFTKADRGLAPIARLGNYRGFIFGSLDAAVPSLDDHLGDAKFFIDLVVDQAGPDGLEVIPGLCIYSFDGNWKMQMENAVDGYHVTHLHSTLTRITTERRQGLRGEDKVQGTDLETLFNKKLAAGTYVFPHGHHVTWRENPDPENRPLYYSVAEMARRAGPLRAGWVNCTRNLNIYPNLTIADIISLQIRVIRPLGAGRSEMRSFCLGAKGESDAVRNRRLRQFEDFYNPSGLAVPDDNVAFEYVQDGYQARALEWLDLAYLRGTGACVAGPDRYAREIGITPLSSSSNPDFHHQDETLYQQVFREWCALMERGQARALATG